MPLYEYECAACGERTEAIQTFSEPPLTVCPNCGGALAKLLSSPAFQFKGAGWYVTDYGKSGGQKDGEKREREEGKEKEKDSSKGEEGVGARSAASGEGAAGETGKGKEGGSSKGKNDGPSGAAPASPEGRPSHAPSKKKTSRRK